jgi:toxin ParE1/3/4
MKIFWSPLAIDRVSEIAAYIAQENPTAAEKWVNTVFRKVEDLRDFPERGRVVPETENKAIREVIYGNYRLICRLEEKRISVLTVRHGKQILPVDEIMAYLAVRADRVPPPIKWTLSTNDRRGVYNGKKEGKKSEPLRQ